MVLILFLFSMKTFRDYSWVEQSYIPLWHIRLHHERWFWRCSGHSFVRIFLKEIQIILILIICFWASEPQNVPKLLLFFYIFDPRCSYKICSYQRKVYLLYYKNVMKNWFLSFRVISILLINDTYRENYVLLNSVQEFIEIEAWLLLTFFQ